MPHFPPPFQIPPKVGLFRRTPPAIFPAVLGLLGLGIAWKRAVFNFGFPSEIVDVFLGMVTLLFLYCLVAYAAKVVLRPAVLAEDLNVLPGRTGLSALAVAMMALAAILADFAPFVAFPVLGLGVFGLLAIALRVLPARLKGADPSGPATPALHLVFVGFVVAPLAGAPLGVEHGILVPLIWYCVLSGALITAITIGPLLRGTGAPPLRPLHAIHLAPPSFIASASVLTLQETLAAASLAWAALVFAALLLRLRWLTEGGFSGFWSAFTFPLTAFAGALMLAGSVHGWESLRFGGGVLLVVATLVVPTIAVKVLKLWATGLLAAKTNAAIA